LNQNRNTKETNAVVDATATIGQGTTIGDFCYIGKNVTIGANNTIEPYAIIESNTTIGDNNHIASYAVVGSAPQDIKTTSPDVSLKIGSNNFIGSHSLISAGTDHGGMVTRIGNNNKLHQKIHIGHDVQMADECVMDDDSALGGHITISNGVHFKDSSAVHQFVDIAKYATIESNAALTHDVPPFCIASGNRAKIVDLDKEKASEILGAETAQELKDAYDYMTEGGHSPYEYACIALQSDLSSEVRDFYSFIANSQRGVSFTRSNNVN